MINTRGWVAVAGLGALVLVAGCSSSAGARSDQSDGATTVSVRDVAGVGKVLADAHGRTLYTSDQERAAGRILCASGACTAIWTPLTVAKGAKPTAPSGVSAGLGTVSRPDGSRQVAFMGEPLYTFSFDHSAGEVKGNGVQDSFGGTAFTWHAATADGAQVAPASTSPTVPGYGPGGY
jgi:predicted lipoprotein with Yx(FWY)xxD motif